MSALVGLEGSVNENEVEDEKGVHLEGVGERWGCGVGWKEGERKKAGREGGA